MSMLTVLRHMGCRDTDGPRRQRVIDAALDGAKEIAARRKCEVDVHVDYEFPPVTSDTAVCPHAPIQGQVKGMTQALIQACPASALHGMAACDASGILDRAAARPW